jgi:hypothetical protein
MTSGDENVFVQIVGFSIILQPDTPAAGQKLLPPAITATIPNMIWRAVLWSIALAAALVPLPPLLVERIYTRQWFPLLQPLLTGLSNRVPFACFDLLLAGALVWCAVITYLCVFGRGRTTGRRVVFQIAVRLVSVAAAAYLVFLMTWGLNYRRLPMVQRVAFDATRISSGAALALADETVRQVNALYEPAHREGGAPLGTIDPVLADAFMRAQVDLGGDRRFIPGRPKVTLLDGYFRRAGVAGMTDPYFLETLVASDLLPIERPMVIAHEWSHLAGIADEGEANFAGWLACIHGSAFHQYSGWLFLYSEVAATLGPADWRRLSVTLDTGPRHDLLAIRERVQEHLSPIVSAAGWRVYDQYLKANRVDRGTASYTDVVRLVLGTRFDSDGKLRRS